jgi:hypothetical protein
VLAPSIVIVVLWLVASGYLVFQGFYTSAVAKSVRSVSIPAVAALTSIQQERRLSISHHIGARPYHDVRQPLDTLTHAVLQQWSAHAEHRHVGGCRCDGPAIEVVRGIGLRIEADGPIGNEVVRESR